jgi:hypothetical protein
VLLIAVAVAKKVRNTIRAPRLPQESRDGWPATPWKAPRRPAPLAVGDGGVAHHTAVEHNDGALRLRDVARLDLDHAPRTGPVVPRWRQTDQECVESIENRPANPRQQGNPRVVQTTSTRST